MNSQELFEYLIEDNTVDPSQLDEIILTLPDEDLYLEYKDGKLTRDLRRCRQYVREDVSAFANSDGGVFVLGVDENRPRQISPCERPGGQQPLDQWATRCLQDMVPFFSPQPRFQVVSHPAGEVLVIAIERAPLLVPCVESGQLKYFLRIGDSTISPPEYLISDLILGRRQRPMLDLHVFHITQQTTQHPAQGRMKIGNVSFQVENLSMVAAEEIDAGMISLALADNPSVIAPGRQLLHYLDNKGVKGPQRITLTWSLHHARPKGQHRSLGPLEGPLNLVFRPAYLLPPADARVTAAVYVIARATPPIWFELEFSTTVYNIPEISIDNCRLTRITAGRPKVAWSIKP